MPFCGSFGEFYQQKCLIMHGYSALVVPQPRDWGDACAITGYWFLNHPPHWRPPAALVDFLAAGPAPVCAGFGSMHTRSLAVRVDLVLQALARMRQRGVLLTGWGGVSNAALPNGIFQIEEGPHDWLFPRVSVVIHHGGAGTTAAALRAGVPEIVLPFYFDQAFWGQRVAALWVGPRPIPRWRLSVEVLTTALQAATSQPAMRWRAAALGRRIHAEDGVARAVQFFHQHLSRR